MSTRYIPPERWPWALGVYAGSGVIVALSAEPLAALAARLGLRPVLGIVLMANLLYPTAILAAAVWFPRKRLVPLGVLCTLLAFTVTRGLLRDWHFWLWPPSFLLGNVLHPVIVAGTLVSAGLGVFGAALARPWRRVGRPDDHLRCPACGYLLHGIRAERCPECGVPYARAGTDDGETPATTTGSGAAPRA